MSVTDGDRQQAMTALWPALNADVTLDEMNDASRHQCEMVAQALADERDRTLASCFGRHEPLQLAVAGPGLVTCDGHELRWTAMPPGTYPDPADPARPPRVGDRMGPVEWNGMSWIVP